MRLLSSAACRAACNHLTALHHSCSDLLISEMKASRTHAARASKVLDSRHWHYLLGFICVCGNSSGPSGAGRSGNLRVALNFSLKSRAAFGSNFFNSRLPPREAVAFRESFSDQPHLRI